MRRLIGILTVVAAWIALGGAAQAQFPGGGYWGAYHSNNSNYHKRASYGELRNRLEPDVQGTDRDPHFSNSNHLLGWGLTGNGTNAYQGNGYRGRSTSMYYGYWDGGFNPGLYGFSMYPHFDRPGFTYWQGGN
ncbi:MAG TPA: hypothetical protein VHB99_14765 [Pirellulales bacterium]|jgi:hypothetical protein|nr:hypothetical protein [Pirellulales bacterium]